MCRVQQEQQLVPCGRRRGDKECFLTPMLFVTATMHLPLMLAELTNMSPPLPGGSLCSHSGHLWGDVDLISIGHVGFLISRGKTYSLHI
jgi:hypothetical protein